MTRHYVTAPRARELPVLLASMRRHCRPFVLHVLAWDFDKLSGPAFEPTPEERDVRYGDERLWQCEVTARETFLARHPEMEPSRLPGPPRRPVDEVVTMRWRFYADVLASLRGAPLCCIDGDIHWYSSPEPMWAEIPHDAPFAVSPHRIPPRAAGLPGVCRETHGVYGEFNTGLSVWRAAAPLEEMAALNREWSYTEVVPRPGRRPLFGDQAHVEDLAEKYGAYVFKAPGLNWAPWNAHVHTLAAPTYADHPFVDGQPLICAHLSSLRLNPDGTVAQLANPCYEVERAPGARELIYEPYLAAIRKESAP